MKKAKETFGSPTSKMIAAIALFSGLSIQELKAQKIQVPDSSAMRAYDQVKSEVDIWKNSLESSSYRDRLLHLLGGNTVRTDQVIKERKDSLESATINILTTGDFADTLKKYNIYSVLGFKNKEKNTIYIGTNLGDKKKGRKYRNLNTALYSTSQKEGVPEGITIHEVGHLYNLTKEEEAFILSMLPLSLQEKITSAKGEKNKSIKKWEESLEEIYPRIAEISYFLTWNGLAQGEITIESMKLFMKEPPKALGAAYRDLRETAGIPEENMVNLLNKLPLPVLEKPELVTKL
jgi:hypothetical protein